MTQRVNYMKQSPALFKKFVEFNTALKESAVEEAIQYLLEIRASHMNGCSFCLDMHVKQAKIHGERELRLHHIAAWRESTLFLPRERAALAWTEVLTKLPEQGVPDDIYERVREQFSERELSDLTFSVMSINAWNRTNIGFKTVPGSADAAFGLDKANLKCPIQIKAVKSSGCVVGSQSLGSTELPTMLFQGRTKPNGAYFSKHLALT